jgi:uncharacterized protein
MMMGLPKATARKLECQVDLEIPMRDGVVLLANRVAPVGGEALPIILIRDPYTFRGTKPDVMSQLIAERGYQVIFQNCRGRWGSGGDFQPFRNERQDGLTTLAWISKQPWFSGSVGMYGLSYWGYVQLASGPGAPVFLKALVPQMAASRIYRVFRPSGTLALFGLLTWLYSTFLTNLIESPKERRTANARSKSDLERGFLHLPFGSADEAALGFPVPFCEEVIRNDRSTDAFWAAMDHSRLIGEIAAPVHFIGGWYDFFLADELADYESLRAAGKKPYLTIGPWTHADLRGVKAGFRESFAWYDAYLRGNTAARRSSPVRVFVMGSKRWAELSSWPPACSATAWYLNPGGGLTREAPAIDSEPSRFHYDPAHPTPSAGGAMISGGGAKDNRPVEARSDVLTFTSAPMLEEVTIMGRVSAELAVRSSNEHTDIFARLCDVSPGGRRSMNICDGIVRLLPGSTTLGAEGVHRITIELLSTAHCFKRGHRIRIQVSSGAHPMFARNLGTGDPLATGTRMDPADQELFHDRLNPSRVVLPVVPATA